MERLPEHMCCEKLYDLGRCQDVESMRRAASEGLPHDCSVPFNWHIYREEGKTPLVKCLKQEMRGQQGEKVLLSEPMLSPVVGGGSTFL